MSRLEPVSVRRLVGWWESCPSQAQCRAIARVSADSGSARHRPVTDRWFPRESVAHQVQSAGVTRPIQLAAGTRTLLRVADDVAVGDGDAAIGDERMNGAVIAAEDRADPEQAPS